MDRDALFTTFLDDAGMFIDRLNNTLMHLEKEPDNLNLVHQAFRFVHSIKSEASYLQLDDITKASHNLETLLDIARRANRGFDVGEIGSLYECVDELQQKFIGLETGHAEEESFSPEEEGYMPEEGPVGSAPSDLDRELLLEAQQRGERLFRLSCEIDEAAPMKKSRVFLIVNNLELIVNVITMIPPLEEERDDQFRVCTIIFTSDRDEEAIRDAVCVDQVRKVQISPLDYESFTSVVKVPVQEETGKPAGRQEGFYRISHNTIDELFEYLDQLKLTTFRLAGDRALREGKEEGEFRKTEAAGIRKLTENLEALLKDIRKVRLNTYFSRFHRMVRDLAADLGKKVDLEMDFGDLSLDRNTAEVLSDILAHIIRNAVDHGIETPEERQDVGKPEKGRIDICAELNEEVIQVSVRDDGRGIDEVMIRHLASERGIDTEGMELLDILAAPGFSSRRVATDYSGRGVGLDVVRGSLEKTGGGTLSLESTVEEGCLFIIKVPLVYNPVGVILVRCDKETLAVPLKNIRDRFVINSEAFSRDERGYLRYDGNPVFGPGGRLFYTEPLPKEQYGIVLRYLGSRGVLLVDEMLFEKEISEESMDFTREVRPHVFSPADSGKKAEYLFLSPSLISPDL